MTVKTSNRKNMWMIVLFAIMAAFIVWVCFNSTPANAIKSCLQSEFHLTVQEVKLESTGKNIYKLLDAPTDPATGIKLENWQIVSFGTTGAVTFANPLDMPQITTVPITVRLSEDERNRLDKLASENGQSLEEMVQEVLMQKLEN